MSNDKFFDFDQFMEERGGGKFEVKAFGETLQIPNDIPFDIVLKISRAFKSGKKEMDDDAVLEMATTIFGEENFKYLLKKGIGLNSIMLLTEKVMEMYMGNASEMTQKNNTP